MFCLEDETERFRKIRCKKTESKTVQVGRKSPVFVTSVGTKEKKKECWHKLDSRLEQWRRKFNINLRVMKVGGGEEVGLGSVVVKNRLTNVSKEFTR